MSDAISYLVVSFERDEHNQVVPGKPLRAPNGNAAIRRAKDLVSLSENIGAAALWTANDLRGDELAAASILATFGEVGLYAGPAEPPPP